MVPTGNKVLCLLLVSHSTKAVSYQGFEVCLNLLYFYPSLDHLHHLLVCILLFWFLYLLKLYAKYASFFLRIKNVLFVSNVFIVNRESIKPYGFVGCKASCTCKSFSAQAHLRPGDFEILSKSKAWQSQV